jgi:hypothetical protein
MISYPNILSIMGEGRNVGKTQLACSIIAKFGRQHNINGLKITPHKHKDTGNAQTILKIEGSILLEETNPQSIKDTGRMLAAGAIKSFLLQTTDEGLNNSLQALFSMIGKDSLVVCESGKLNSYNPTGISLFVRQLNCHVYDSSKKVPDEGIDRIVSYTVNGFDLDLNKIVIENNIWKFKEK